MMADHSPASDPDVIASHLRHITRRWGELQADCLFEIRMLSAADKAEVKDVRRYKPTEEGIADAAEHVASMNQHQLNAYVVVNPVNATAYIKAGKAATDTDIVASFFHWADADDAQAAANIKNFVGPRPTFYVLTGMHPSPRPHVYWELEEPSLNLDAWSTTQRAIAATLKTDRSVVNPSRIMRIAGTVNWPKPQKQAKGYIREVTRLTIHDEDERPLVSSERIARAFATAPAPDSDTSFHIDTGINRKSVEDYADALRRARTDGEKHTGVRDLTATLAGAGAPRALAEAIVRDACPVWDEGVEKLIDTAYAKFYKQTDAPFEALSEAREIEWPTPLNDFDEATLPRREWVYGTDYIRSYISVVASAGGIGKTSNATVEGLAITTGRPLLGVEVKQPCNVWIVNLEDPRSELQMRTLAAMKHYHIKPDEVRGKLFIDGEDTIQITLAMENRDGVQINDPLADAMIRKIKERNIGVVIFDPFISTHLVNENSNAAIQAVVALFRRIARETNASVCLVHHIRKGNGDDATIDSVRGAGSLIGAARAARIMNRISREEAERVGIEAKEARSIFRVDDGKANLAPPAESAIYRKMIGVKLDNDEWVGVAVPFELPDEWVGMTDDVVNTILARIDGGIDGNGEELYSLRPQDKGRWVGKVIADYQFDNPDAAKAPGQIKAILREWQKNGLIEEVEYRSPSQRKDRKGVMSTGRVGADQ